jgi:hypothetical protein
VTAGAGVGAGAAEVDLGPSVVTCLAEQADNIITAVNKTARANKDNFFIEFLLQERQLLLPLMIYTEKEKKYYKGN